MQCHFVFFTKWTLWTEMSKRCITRPAYVGSQLTSNAYGALMQASTLVDGVPVRYNGYYGTQRWYHVEMADTSGAQLGFA